MATILNLSESINSVEAARARLDDYESHASYQGLAGADLGTIDDPDLARRAREALDNVEKLRRVVGDVEDRQRLILKGMAQATSEEGGMA